MSFSIAEKINLLMLCDLGLPEARRELDYDFLYGCIRDGDLWAIDWRYPGWDLDVPTPPEVQRVCAQLDMWSEIERSFDRLSSTEKARVKTEGYCHGDPRFDGYDGNRGTEYNIANLLIHKLDRWGSFKGRDLNSHAPVEEVYERLLAVYEPIYKAKPPTMGGAHLSADELITILRERVHPSHRVPGSGGTWSFKGFPST